MTSVNNIRSKGIRQNAKLNYFVFPYYILTSALLIIALSLLSRMAYAQSSLFGYWVLEGEPVLDEIMYTDEGKRRLDSYDFLVDDPMLKCIPPSVARAWSHPGTPFELKQMDDKVVIRYELFDMTRTIKINEIRKDIVLSPSTTDVNGKTYPTMGHSSAWYEDQSLVIETTGYAPGYILTSKGLPQSEATRTLERLSRSKDRLVLGITYWDPILYKKPYTVHYKFRNYPEKELLEYACTVENLIF